MATIIPFCPLYPNPQHATGLVLATPQAESVTLSPSDEGQQGHLVLKDLLETGARQRPETAEGQAEAYRQVRAALDALLTDGRLSLEEESGIYIYEVAQNGRRQTGVWALTALEDYRSGRIRVHEKTLSDSLRRLRNYREHTGLEGNPVLLAYQPDALVTNLLAEVKRGPSSLMLSNGEGLHQVWKVTDRWQLELLTTAFAQIRTIYLADGHHRLESACILSRMQAEGGRPVYGHISSLYLAADQLRIEAFHRVVLPERACDTAELLGLLGGRFHLLESTGNRPVVPEVHGRIGMLLNGTWYHLMLRSYFTGEVPLLDAEVLQEHVLEPLFGIADPQRDRRLRYAGGEGALGEVLKLCAKEPSAIAFTLVPVSVEQLMAVADEGRVLPPKATWIVPKVPYGLLMHRHGEI